MRILEDRARFFDVNASEYEIWERPEAEYCNITLDYVKDATNVLLRT